MRRLLQRALLGISLAAAAAACGDDDDEPKGLAGNTACEKWQSLSLLAECDFPQNCDIIPACSQLAITWMECTAKSITQCRCEMDLQLNCEGSHNPNEGPALCGGQYRAYNDCVLDNQ